MQATFDNCNNFNVKLQDTLKGLINANGERKSEIEALRNDHEDLKKVSTILNAYCMLLVLYVTPLLLLYTDYF